MNQYVISYLGSLNSQAAAAAHHHIVISIRDFTIAESGSPIVYFLRLRGPSGGDMVIDILVI